MFPSPYFRPDTRCNDTVDSEDLLNEPSWPRDAHDEGPVAQGQRIEDFFGRARYIHGQRSNLATEYLSGQLYSATEQRPLQWTTAYLEPFAWP